MTADAIFDTVSAVEAAAGDTEYRCVYIRNNGTMTLDVVSLYVSDTPTTGVLAIALGGEGIGGTAETVGNENTAPSGESFSTPTTSGTGLTAGPLAVGEARPVWLRRTITAGAGGIALGSNSAAISAYLHKQGARAKNDTLVSSDRTVQASARAHHLQVISSPDFASKITAALSSPSVPAEPETTLSADELRMWEQMFKSGKVDDE